MKKTKKKKDIPQVNMTAMPDIIFMLLFFFMVATVIKPPTENEELVLPNTITSEATERTNPDELQIFMYKNETDQHLVSINKIVKPLNLVEDLMAYSINQLKHKQLFPDKAILKIDKDVNIASVNQVKRALQKAEILKVEYVHTGGTK